MVRPTIKSCRFQISGHKARTHDLSPDRKSIFTFLLVALSHGAFSSFPYMPMNLCIVFGTIVVGL